MLPQLMTPSMQSTFTKCCDIKHNDFLQNKSHNPEKHRPNNLNRALLPGGLIESQERYETLQRFRSATQKAGEGAEDASLLFIIQDIPPCHFVPERNWLKCNRMRRERR